MAFPLRLPRYVAPVLLAGLSVVGCTGHVDPTVGGGEPPPVTGGSSSSGGSPAGSSSGASGSSSGTPASSSSSSGGSSGSSSGGRRPGDPDCSRLGLPDLARVCPDGTSVAGQYVLSNHQCVLQFPCPPSPPPGGQCSQGATCSAGISCGLISPGPSSCSTSCSCDSTGHYQCGVMCSGPPTPTGCTQGASCFGAVGCGTASSDPNGCSTSCSCNPMGFFDCTTDCVDAGPPVITDPCPGLALPDTCQVCSNGITECAHAILVMGQCEIRDLPRRVVAPAR